MFDAEHEIRTGASNLNTACAVLIYIQSLLFCEEPSAATIVFDVKYALYTWNTSLVLLVILCWFYCILFEACNIFCQKLNADTVTAE